MKTNKSESIDPKVQAVFDEPAAKQGKSQPKLTGAFEISRVTLPEEVVSQTFLSWYTTKIQQNTGEKQHLLAEIKTTPSAAVQRALDEPFQRDKPSKKCSIL